MVWQFIVALNFSSSFDDNNTNNNKNNSNDDNEPRCRLCKHTVSRLISECSGIAQTEYKGTRDKLATAVHGSRCKKHKLPRTEKWYDHRTEAVLENKKGKLLWDFSGQTVIEARRPYLILINQETKECQVIRQQYQVTEEQ